VMPAFFMIDDNPTINDKDSFVNFNNPTGDNYNPMMYKSMCKPLQ
jgi:hypothetical protein